MNTDFIKGVVVPILTPVDAEERIDEARLRDQVDYVIDGGVSGILAFGSNGEFYMVEEDEMERGLKIMADQAAGRVPVYFGIGAISTKKCCRLARMAAANGAVGGVCTAANFMPELITDIYNKFVAGDLQGSLEAQFKLNPVRLAMDPASFPVAAKDMALLRGRDMGAPYRPNLLTPEGPVKEGFRRTMRAAGLI